MSKPRVDSSEPSVARAFFTERRPSVSYGKVDMPPLMVKKVEEVSALFGGVIFAFRANASLPMYLLPSAPKPSSVKAKTCKRKGFVEGAIPEMKASVILGNIVKDDKGAKSIQAYKPKELEHPPGSDEITTPTVQLDYSLRQIMEGLQSGIYEMASTPDELKAGHLKVREMTDRDVHGGVIYSVKLDGASKPPLAGVEHHDWRVTEKLPTPEQPDWWQASFGDWSLQVECRYPSFYQANDSVDPLPLMVYGRESEKGVLPITGDQDLLWMTIPVQAREEFKLPDAAFVPINTFDHGDPANGVMSGPAKMFSALIELSEHFTKIGKPEMSLSVLDMDDKVLAGMGIASPYEVYISIFLNKQLGYEADHVRNLIQHGCDNRNPGPPSSLEDKINHVGGGHHLQTRTTRELVAVASSPNYSGKNIIDMHPGWGDALKPLADAQARVRAKADFAPLPAAITARFGLESPEPPPSRLDR